MMVAPLSEDGKWESTDLMTIDIWVETMGMPPPFLTKKCIEQMAKRMGTLIQANEVRKNGVVVNHYLHFHVRLKLVVPLLARVSLLYY
ncbi:hypothetical protein F8388_001864 [Cannabis sativa]|uniref:DUF4283 domain-containing protein n=1 Tax=Cannabis sativa TaxID=3483 RepID=A0A7J6DJ15_CANSA|nr:hypothetical protein G4B88_029194 [Cannabis sativa]KAF4369442.1 hypothetical protein F8388_001864 [Cannabis sativa]KAF4387250.1 hypothetical protein G4B88_020265 [Cannabis sativa]